MYLILTLERIVVKLSIPLVLYAIDMFFPRMRSISKRSVTVFTVIPFPHPLKHYNAVILCWAKVADILLSSRPNLRQLCSRAFELTRGALDRILNEMLGGEQIVTIFFAICPNL